MWAKNSALFEYHPSSNSDFTFYYLPIPKPEQKVQRRRYNEYRNTTEFMQSLLRKRLVLVSESSGHTVYRYEWPSDITGQDHLLSRIPNGVVIELGAAILGWMRSQDEDATRFMERVVGDLKDALTP